MFGKGLYATDPTLKTKIDSDSRQELYHVDRFLLKEPNCEVAKDCCVVLHGCSYRTVFKESLSSSLLPNFFI